MTKANESKTERMTKVAGAYVDMSGETLEKIEFEIEVPYARAEAKLIASVKKHFNLPATAGVAITNIEQPESTRKVYDMNLLYLSGAEMFHDESDAKERAKEINGKCVAGVLYDYETQVFWYDVETEEYGTEKFYWTTGYNCTAQDARAMLRMRFEEMNGKKPIELNAWGNQKGYKKHETPIYYVGSAELFADCEREVKHREK